MAVFQTAIFKAHIPSKQDQAALDIALEHYTYAHQAPLDWSKDNLATLKERTQRNGRENVTFCSPARDFSPMVNTVL